jgi:NAD(P)-dependent dehydrogenase (short-subunit alcohol dehydrogenase family)
MTTSFDLDGRVVIVTGGLGQLGASFTRALLAAGAKVAVLDAVTLEGEDGAARRAALFGDTPDSALRLYQADVTSRASLEDVLVRIQDELGTPYGLINNAALDSPPGAPASENGPFEDYPEASFDRVIDVNVKGVVQCCQVFGKAMAEAGQGSIVNIGSIYGVVSPDQGLYQYRRDRGEVFFKPVAYSVSKSALMNLTRYLAVYWGPKGVRTNTLVFAGVFNNQERAFLDRYEPKVPLGRMAEPADYDGPVVFLMSDASRYMTGSDVVVDGGFTAM